jgi:hypothetical protein
MTTANWRSCSQSAPWWAVLCNRKVFGCALIWSAWRSHRARYLLPAHWMYGSGAAQPESDDSHQRDLDDQCNGQPVLLFTIISPQ